MAVCGFLVETDGVDDLIAKLSNDLRVLGKVIDCPSQRASGGVPAREKDADKLIAKNSSVPRVRSDGMEECVTLIVVRLLLEFFWR